MAMTAQDVRNRRFGATRWREGYDPADVDTLLDRVAGELDSRTAGRPKGAVLTAEAVVRARFEPTVLRQGYDQDEVDDFLDELVLLLRAQDVVPTADPVAVPVPGSRADRAKPYELLALQVIGWLLFLGGAAAEALALTDQPLGLAAMALGAVVSTLTGLAHVRATAPRRGERRVPHPR